MIVLFLVVAVVLLYVFPGRTEELFAWTIEPEMTPMMLATAYISGIYFFLRVVMGGAWRPVAAGFLPVVVFVWFEGAATLIHLDRFNQDHIAFFAWLALYVLSPLAIPLLWLRNSRVAHSARGRFPMTTGLRVALGGAGGAIVVAALVMFVIPQATIDVWGWQLTPLTSRVMAGVIALYGAVWISAAVDGSWEGSRLIFRAQMIGLAAVLLAAARGSGDFDWDRPLAAVFVGGTAAMLLVSAAVYVAMSRQVTAGA